jgi:hypothetical protein
MPSPSSPSTFERPDLGAAYESFDLMSHVNGFVGLRLFKPTPVGVASGNFSKIDLAALLNDGRDVRRAPGAPYSRQQFQFTQDQFACSEKGVEELLDDRERAAYGYTGIRFDQIGADRAVAAVLRDTEYEIQAIVQDSTTYTAQATATAGIWSTHSSGKPVTDILAAREAFKTSCGVYPNALVMSSLAHTHARQCAELLDFVKYGGAPGIDPTKVDESALAQIFQVPNVLIAGAVKNSKLPGVAATIADIWSKSIVTLLRVPETDDLREQCFGRTFMFQDLVLEQYRAEDRRSDVMRARQDLDVKVIQSQCLWMVTGVAA